MSSVRTVDLAVVGGGLAGMTAATRAANEGLSVVVLEKSSDERYFCNSRVSAGVFHIALTDITSDEKLLEDKILGVTGGYAKPELARAIAQDGKRVAKWLQAQGVKFMRGSPEPWHNFVLAPPALVRIGLEFEGRAGDVALRTLEAVFVKAGGNILRGWRAERLIGEKGICTGVAGTAKDGGFEITARAVLIADGGFQANRDLIGKHITPDANRVLQRNTESAVGDGLRMATAFGAATSRLDGFYGHVMNRDALNDKNLWPYPWFDDILTTAIVVGPTGQRFCDEGLGGVYVANRIAALPDPLSAWVIFDEDIWQAGGKARSYPANPHMLKNGGTILTADTLDELAAKTGLPAEALKREVADYNAAIESGTLGALPHGRTDSRYRPLPIRKGPFYAGPCVAGITYTFGGIAIDEWCRALDVSGAPIPGLYAAGAATGGLEGGDSVGYVGGLVKAAVTGLRAAEHAVGALAPA
ncbi:fumarate reductase/succinate dehydrogenase flavoprotein-like protein (plasmid) [Rhizobium gallicum]|uniref:Fumarate reductase/succinate dehydrogenase flavoprotein-like protein n=1 Tax=Rhizobium gallicum TaxID=56730 RepID=A0A1L5NS44_9HYPH|nr:FAD-dependent oxidoreductase [Rhizobium gallicum]APO70721.1 fumarate reductase/succinate dehydrogenase flavoprotein-like protein [Rhizobium gallicum]